MPVKIILMRAVIDTNVILAGLRSSRGSSHAVLRAMRNDRFTAVVTPATMLEYEDVLRRPALLPHFSRSEVEQFLDWFVFKASRHTVYFRWRPSLPNAGDEHILEAAIAGGASHIVTFNVKDLAAAATLGISVVQPAAFLSLLP